MLTPFNHNRISKLHLLARVKAWILAWHKIHVVWWYYCTAVIIAERWLVNLLFKLRSMGWMEPALLLRTLKSDGMAPKWMGWYLIPGLHHPEYEILLFIVYRFNLGDFNVSLLAIAESKGKKLRWNLKVVSRWIVVTLWPRMKYLGRSEIYLMYLYRI